jgi:hypothetical protein
MLHRFGSMTTLPRWRRIAVGLLLAVLAGTLVLLTIRWPYTEDRMIANLERATGSRVFLQRYRATFLPEPGCTIEDLRLDRHGQQPIARAERVTIRSSWWSVLTFQKRVRHIQAERLHVLIPSPLPAPIRTGSSGGLGEVIVGELVADGATLDFISKNGGPPARFGLHQLRLRELGRNKQVAYATVLDIPNPPGQVKSSGTVGPFSSGTHGRTPVGGSFELIHASLDKYEGLAGSVNGKGTFQGPLESIRVVGTATASAFEVNRTGRPVDIRTAYRADVNGLSADVILERVDADFLRTRLSVNGCIQGEHGKTVSLEFLGNEAHVEDLLSLFTRSDRPALRGPIRLRANVDLPRGTEPFLRRLLLRGGFDISNARWTRPRTQMKVNSLSARARGDKKQVQDRSAENVDDVLSQLRGDVFLKDGLASLSDVSFRVPGATATGGGTYNLLNKRVDLRGTVSMVADASEATSGFTSILLKPFDALFRRNHEKGATLLVSIIGQYPRPQYRVSLRR